MKPIELREADFKKAVELLNYPESLKKEFFDYWTEPNKSGTKMRFELEKTWHLGRRIARWASNGFNKETVKKLPVMRPETKPVVTEIDKVDALLKKYQARPTDVPFDEFGKFYDLLKNQRLLRTFTKQEVDDIKEAFSGDNYKCRCACVQKTFDSYTNTAMTFNSIMEIRQRLA